MMFWCVVLALSSLLTGLWAGVLLGAYLVGDGFAIYPLWVALSTGAAILGFEGALNNWPNIR